MKKRLVTLAAAISAVALFTAARPTTSLQLDVQVQPVRWILPDAGRSGISSATDIACMPLLNGKLVGRPSFLIDAGANLGAYVPNNIRLVPLVPINLCVRPAVESPYWDGGCNTLPNDENYGVPYVRGSIIDITPEAQATHICAVGDSGYVSVGAWGLQ